MKNSILLFAIIALTGINSYSQTDSTTSTSDQRDRLLFGVKLGLNYSNVYDAQGENFVADAKFGVALGGFVSIPIGTFIGVQPELLYSQKGYKSSGTFLGTSYSMTRTTDFLDIPIYFVVKPVENISLLFGPQYSYLLKRTDDFTGGSLSASDIQTFTNDNLRKNIFGLAGGLDINIDHLIIGLRAAWDTTSNNGDGTSYTPRYKNMWYQATIGFRF
jgi:hypothetical protein